MTRYEVLVDSLNVREEPRISTPRRANVIQSLRLGQIVESTGRTTRRWVELRLDFGLSGWAATDGGGQVFLRAVDQASAGLGGSGQVPPVDLVRAGVTRSNTLRAYALNEPGAPWRAPLWDIVRWLDVERQAHARWRPGGGATYCNIYAHDVCRIAGAYLPRVFWYPKAVLQLARGQSVRAVYGQSIHELNANTLHGWLGSMGGDYGWRRLPSPHAVQEAANSGQVAVITGLRSDHSRPGHVAVVLPEQGAFKAEKFVGRATKPLTSQAGSTNWLARPSAWFLHGRFEDRGFWASSGTPNYP